MSMKMHPSACPNAERVHRTFLGATELVKKLRVMALMTEIASALIAGWRIIRPELDWPGWASMGLTSVIAIGIVLRIWSKSIGAFAERCRRIVIRAYGEGKDISFAMTTSLTSDAPILAEEQSKKLPTQTLQEYYESMIAPGNSRLRELYTHSAFYSWRLLRVCWRIYLAGAISFGTIGFLVIYGLAAASNQPSTSGRILDLVCSTIFVFLTAKAVIACVDSKQSSAECRRIQEALLTQTADEDPRGLMLDYDVERASGVTIPTTVYRKMRNRLQAEWHAIRQELA